MDATYWCAGYVTTDMRSTRVIVAGTAVSTLLMLAGACAEQDRTGAGAAGGGATEKAPASRELTREPDTRTDTATAATTVPGDRIDATALPEGHPVDVTVSDSGTTLTIVGREGGCSTVSAEPGERNDQRVVVTLVETTKSNENAMCTMDIRHPSLTVQLDAPLGKRRVVLEHRVTLEYSTGTR